MAKNRNLSRIPNVLTGSQNNDATLSANISGNSATFTGTVTAATPTLANHLTTKAYVDALSFGGGGGGGTGTVTSIGVTTANGVSGTSSGGATPNLTISLGAITPVSVVASGTITASNLGGTNTGDNATNSLYSGLISNATHTGEVTGATALTITNNAVTLSKIQQVATNTLLGRGTASTGNVEVITIGSGLTLSAGILTAAGGGGGGGGTGTVTSVSVTTANGVSGTVATSTTTPAITLSLGAITPSSVVSVGAVTGSNLSGTNTGDNATNTQYSGLVSNVAHTGDATGSGVLTLATVNANIGTFNNVTVNGKGLVTSASNASYEAPLTFSTGLSRSGNTITNTITQYTDALSRASLSFGAGSGAYNSSTGVITIPTNNNQIANGSGFLTGITSGQVTTALGFTPYNSTNPSGFITSSALSPYALTSSIPTNNNQLSNGSGFLTGITSGQVTGALGFTPYNSSNPSGFITSSALSPYALISSIPTNNNQLSNGSGFITASSLGPYALLSGANFSGAIGGTTASFSGTVTASGGFFNSDIRLKDLVIPYDYTKIASLTPITFAWKDKRDGAIHYGYSAQEVEKFMPNAIKLDDKGFMSVNYTEVLVAKVKHLENEIAQLKLKLN